MNDEIKNSDNGEDGAREAYHVEIKFCGKKFYTVWETGADGIDALWTKDGKILIGREKIADARITDTEDPSDGFYDFDAVRAMLDDRFKHIDYNGLLSFWNLTQDAADTLNIEFIGSKKRYDRIYEQTFYGTNVLAKSPEEYYTPQMTKKDVDGLCMVVAAALELWSGILSGIAKDEAKKRLRRKYGYAAGKYYVPLEDIDTKADNFFIMRGTIDNYEREIKSYLHKKYGHVFYLSVDKQAYYPWKKDYFEMSDIIEFGDNRAEAAMFPADYSFLIYVSHEQTVTFAGDIVGDIKKILAPVAHKFDKYILV